MPDALIITAAGINCEGELAQAFEQAGARSRFVHLNRLLADPAIFDRFDLIGVPGGFSFGDAVGAGRIAAQLMRQGLYRPLVRAIQRGVPIIAPCNGFQILAQLGLLPGPAPGERWPDEPPRPTVALAPNESARFVDRWCRVEIPADSRCIWTRGIGEKETSQPGAKPRSHEATKPRSENSTDQRVRVAADGGRPTSSSLHALTLPVAHGEGRFIAQSPQVLEDLQCTGRIAVRYAPDDNPNGSSGHVAGICDAGGLVLGLMPHPERFTRWTQHPAWTRLDQEMLSTDPAPGGRPRGPVPALGLAMFRNAVAHARATRQQTSSSDGSTLASR